MRIKFFFFVLLSMMVLFRTGSTQNNSNEKGVYQFVVRNADMNYEAAVSAIRTEIEKSPFLELGRTNFSETEECEFGSTVIMLYEPNFVKQIISENSLTGPFAAVDRINIFDDEEGTHVSIVNPENILRTVLMDDVKYAEIAENHASDLREIIQSAVQGEIVLREYGPIRKKGYIGRTMGVMAGGSFDGKVNELFSIENKNLAAGVSAISNGFEKETSKWGLHIKYSLKIPDSNIVILGLSGIQMEAKSYSIVKAGGDKSRKKLACPGIAHAGAYPIEIVITEENSSVKIKGVDTMYRMKMFFEDAGKWAFMKNMGMPGSINDEIKNRIQEIFENQ